RAAAGYRGDRAGGSGEGRGGAGGTARRRPRRRAGSTSPGPCRPHGRGAQPQRCDVGRDGRAASRRDGGTSWPARRNGRRPHPRLLPERRVAETLDRKPCGVDPRRRFVSRDQPRRDPRPAIAQRGSAGGARRPGRQVRLRRGARLRPFRHHRRRSPRNQAVRVVDGPFGNPRMSMAAPGDEPRQEIIIVRRNYDHDEGHHGGVWKIAFADFMTAMMCFFLVMWLINAANEQTKAAVASYFNPVRLIDRNASRKGLQDLGDGPRSVGLTAQKPEKDMDRVGHQGDDDAQMPQAQPYTEGLPKPTEATDARLFSDPYAVLSEIATNTGILQNVSDKGEGGVQTSGPATGASGGQSYRDPFSPDFWSQQQASPAAEASAERARIKGEPA